MRVRFAAAAAGSALLLAAVPAGGYRFVGDASLTPTSGEAIRWRASDFPLRFRMLENDLAPAGVELDAAAFREIVERSLVRWTAIPTARIEIVLEEETVALSQADADDGINTIGFSAHEEFRDTWITAWAAWSAVGNRITDCDIEVNPDYVKNWGPGDPRRWLEIIVVHEVGHCLGLAHTEPHPMPLWTERMVAADPSFLPDPIMSYSNSYGLELPEDDTVPVSLLYPAPGFLASRGAVLGRVLVGERPAAHAYVQAVRPGAPGVRTGPRSGPGPGTFADEAGLFHLEGLSPGPWMLWVHPILITRRNSHGDMTAIADEAGATEFRDQLRWVRVEAGEVLDEVKIVVRSGRELIRP